MISTFFVALSWTILGYIIIGLVLLSFNLDIVDDFISYLEENKKSLLMQIEMYFSIKVFIIFLIVLVWPGILWTYIVYDVDDDER